MTDNKKISDLTLGELRQFIQDCMKPQRMISGYASLAKELDISVATAKRYVATGVLDDAIVKFRKSVLFDVEKVITILQNKQIKIKQHHGN